MTISNLLIFAYVAFLGCTSQGLWPLHLPRSAYFRRIGDVSSCSATLLSRMRHASPQAMEGQRQDRKDCNMKNLSHQSMSVVQSLSPFRCHRRREDADQDFCR